MYIEVTGARLFFDVEGSKLVCDGPVMRERPTVLCLHGGPGLDHSFFRPGFSTLARVAQVIYLDQRGHGRSDRCTPDTWSLARWGDDVREFCDVLGIERPVVLGTSFGGYVAMAYAVRHPQHPAKLVLISTALRGTGNPIRRRRVLDAFERRGGVAAREAVREGFDARTPQAYEAFSRVCGPLYNNRPIDSDAAKRIIRNPTVLPHFEGAGAEGVVFDLSAELWRLRCPTLVVAGDDDPMTPPSELKEIVKALPRGVARLERISGAGHGIYRDQPERLLQLVSAFVASSV